MRVLFVWIVMQCVEGRGPHHPRGEPVLKKHHQISKEAKLTQDEEILHDKQHLQEHLDTLSAEDLSKMTDEELEFHYFQVHDSDRNNQLDGLEILQAILHTQHEHEGEELNNEVVENSTSPQEDLNYIIDVIDRVLLEDDFNKDGYISYPEYVAGRKNSRNFNGYTNIPSAKLVT